MTRGLLVGLLAAVLLFAGCVTVPFTLIDLASAKVDRAYVGDFDAVNADGKHSSLIIRNIDDKQFFIEMRDEDKTEVSRMTGFIFDIKGATFAQVRGLTDDGTLDENWMVMRLQLTGENLIIKQLSEAYFKAHPANSADEMRKILEKESGNEEIYEKKETVTATRVAK